MDGMGYETSRYISYILYVESLPRIYRALAVTGVIVPRQVWVLTSGAKH
jgi:hypothetical protein